MGHLPEDQQGDQLLTVNGGFKAPRRSIARYIRTAGMGRPRQLSIGAVHPTLRRIRGRLRARSGPRSGLSGRQLFDSFLETHHKTEVLRRWFREVVLRYRTSQVNAVLPQEIVYLRNDRFWGSTLNTCSGQASIRNDPYIRPLRQKLPLKNDRH